MPADFVEREREAVAVDDLVGTQGRILDFRFERGCKSWQRCGPVLLLHVPDGENRDSGHEVAGRRTPSLRSITLLFPLESTSCTFNGEHGAFEPPAPHTLLQSTLGL